MINLEDEIIFNLDKSCTKEVAVAKMLGWMRGSKRLKYPRINKFNTGIEEEDLPHIYQLFFPLNNQLAAVRQVVWNQIIDIADAAKIAKEIGDENEYLILAEKYCVLADKLDICDKNAENSLKYLLAIDHEFSKGKDSLIIEDELATIESGKVHFTIVSLDLWVRKTFKDVSVTEENIDIAVANISSDNSSKPIKAKYDALRPELDAILDKMDNPTPSRVMAELRKLVGTNKTCVLGLNGDGIKWEQNNGVPQNLNLSSLGMRINTWRKTKLN